MIRPSITKTMANAVICVTIQLATHVCCTRGPISCSVWYKAVTRHTQNQISPCPPNAIHLRPSAIMSIPILLWHINGYHIQLMWRCTVMCASQKFGGPYYSWFIIDRFFDCFEWNEAIGWLKSLRNGPSTPRTHGKKASFFFWYARDQAASAPP